MAQLTLFLLLFAFRRSLMTDLYIRKICYRTFSFKRSLEMDDMALLYSHL